ncbi:hypothetical protein MAIC_15730 [Mycolicibacterium aichiense]|uniref:Uncharacterized protein n=1 Tax=Mycolicibacterium aichiense TaxID=1799 RepID=A0AAD1HL30_9MYCO|nr:hypothetical protein MAIC_15730 [Mycolicibacterium aichiense]
MGYCAHDSPDTGGTDETWILCCGSRCRSGRTDRYRLWQLRLRQHGCVIREFGGDDCECDLVFEHICECRPGGR